MQQTETIVLGGGCFWCTEAIFRNLRGVITVIPGYAGGVTENPTYQEVSFGDTGHAEVISVEYDPQIIPAEDLLDIFFHLHDPTTLNRQGSDTGRQYRSVIFYTTVSQKNTARELIGKLTREEFPHTPVVTEIQPLTVFYPAEKYHENYYENNPEKPYCQLIISPKLRHLREKYARFINPGRGG
jgi:peptide-methionine (S)-S-oxide reductase